MVSKKQNKGKPNWALFPIVTVNWIIAALQAGLDGGYKKDSWMEVKNFKDEYYSALMRHLAAYRSGETYDEKSNLNHLAHVACNAIMLVWYEIKMGIKLHK